MKEYEDYQIPPEQPRYFVVVTNGIDYNPSSKTTEIIGELPKETVQALAFVDWISDDAYGRLGFRRKITLQCFKEELLLSCGIGIPTYKDCYGNEQHLQNINIKIVKRQNGRVFRVELDDSDFPNRGHGWEPDIDALQKLIKKHYSFDDDKEDYQPPRGII